MKFLNGNENYKCETLSTTSILKYSNGLSPTTTANVATNNYNLNFEKTNISTSDTIIIKEGKTATDLKGIGSKESANVNNEISTTGYKENNNLHVTSPSTTVTEAINSESTQSHTVNTTAVDVRTTFRTTLNDASTESSKQKSAYNQEDIILPILLVSLGSLAAAILIWMVIRKFIDLKKSGQYSKFILFILYFTSDILLNYPNIDDPRLKNDQRFLK